MEIGPQAKSDNAITKKYRLHQSEYRAKILKVPYGVGPNKNSKTKYGNFLVNGEVNGLNFITKEAFYYAKQRVLDKQINNYLTIDEYRLFNNMLSSMPMCFNLFSDLRRMLIYDPKSVSKTIKKMFKEIEWVDDVTYIGIEFLPLPIYDYTNDKSAFDAVVLVKNQNGNKGIISIETKYTDLLGTNTASNSEIKNKIIKNNKIFKKDYVEYLINNGYKQIHRNYLLTYSFAKKHNIKNYTNIIISPEDDNASIIEIKEIQKNLINNKETILKISLEDVVKRALLSESKKIKEVMNKFKQRYIINQ